MEINSIKDDKNIVIFLNGEIDLYDAPKMKQIIHQLIDECNISIQINCEELQYIDSTGIGVLMGTLRKCKENNIELQIVNLKPHIQKIFKITGLYQIFKIGDEK